MSNRKYRPFTRKVTVTLRCVVRLTEDGYVADCIDAGSIGIGETQQDALKALTESLEAMFRVVGKKMKRAAHPEDEQLYARLVSASTGVGDGDVVSWGELARIEVVPTAAAKKDKHPVRKHAAFEITHLAKAA